jgi:hypothetical protein
MARIQAYARLIMRYEKWLIAVMVALQGLLWLGYVGSDRGLMHGPAVEIAVAVGIAIGNIWALVAGVLRGDSIGTLLIYTAITFSALVQGFSGLYWSYGTAVNFSQALSKWDAVYFTLGTLTTAGTGNLWAKSEIAKQFVSLQLLVDLLFVGGAVALVVARLGERRK